jgi:hypothetical protein
MKNPQIKIIIKGDRHIESNVPAPFRDALNTVGEAVRARRKAAKKQRKSSEKAKFTGSK